jgi:hypothetical protein
MVDEAVDGWWMTTTSQIAITPSTYRRNPFNFPANSTKEQKLPKHPNRKNSFKLGSIVIIRKGVSIGYQPASQASDIEEE